MGLLGEGMSGRGKVRGWRGGVGVWAGRGAGEGS